MAEATEATPTTPTTPPQPNTPEARTPTGEIKDQTNAQPSGVEPAKPAEPAAAAEPSAVPESYKFVAPEGTTLDDAAIGRATPIFKELGLTQTQAQQLVDFYTKEVGGINKAMTDQVTAMRTDWRTQSSALPNIEAIKTNFATAMSQLDPKVASDFRAALDLTGAGDHPAVITAIGKLVESLSEGRHVNGNSPSPHGQSANGRASRPSAAAAMYPTLSQ